MTDSRSTEAMSADEIMAVCKQFVLEGYNGNYFEDDGYHLAREVERLTIARLRSSGGARDEATWNANMLADANATIARLRGELEAADHDSDACMKERDDAEEQADKLADCIAGLLGIDIGEHSSGNAPWQNAIDAAEYELDKRKRSAPEPGDKS